MTPRNEWRNRNQLAESILPMLEDLRQIREACSEAAKNAGERWRIDQLNLIDRIIHVGDACQIFDALDVLTGGDYVGPSSVVELATILANVPR